MTEFTIIFGSDHRGLPLKSRLLARVKERGHAVIDLGADSEDSCVARDHHRSDCAATRDGPDYVGVLICGSGQAMAMTANRYKHIRAALCLNTTMARLAREHNDANVLVLGAHIIGQEVAFDCLDVFLNTEFAGGRFTPRRDKLAGLGGL